MEPCKYKQILAVILGNINGFFGSASIFRLTERPDFLRQLARIVLPFASVIECGNHITQIKGADPKRYIDEFDDFILKSIDGQEPWDIFTNQSL